MPEWFVVCETIQGTDQLIHPPNSQLEMVTMNCSFSANLGMREIIFEQLKMMRRMRKGEMEAD